MRYFWIGNILIGMNLINPVFAYEYSVRSSFCTDYARNNSSLTSSSFHYDYQVAYNACMKKADSLIDQHEQDKDRSRRELQDINRRHRIEREAAEQDRIRKKEAEKIRLQNLINNVGDFFY